MKHPQLTFRFVACAMLALFSPWTLAQTCVAGIQASNPTSVYVVDSANGTVFDTRTGLMWDRCALGQSGVSCASGTASTFTWKEALNAAPALGTYKGYSDWRLPNVKELRSLVEECRVSPSINELAFPNAPGYFFWSGSPYAGGPADAWGVYFGLGFAYLGVRYETPHVRLVRAGP